MTIASHQRMIQLEARVKSLEEALNILLREPPRVEIDVLESMPVIQKIKNDIQGLKMRAGKHE